VVAAAAHRWFAWALVVLAVPAPAFAQAFTPPAQVGSVTAAWQWVDNTGHIFTDGTFVPAGQSVTTSALIEVDYGVSDRFAMTASVPYIFARYTGGLPPRSGLAHDACRCWNSSLQDFVISGRYRFGDEFWTITPQARYIVPTHGYNYLGEAVVGPKLQQFLMSLHASWRFAALPKASVQGGYTFALTEQAVDDVRVNRSNTYFSLGYALTRSLYVHGGALYQNAHGGVTVRDLATGAAPPEQAAQADRLLKMRFWHMTGGVSYSAGFADLYFAVEPYIWGRDTHDGIAYNVGSTWYFDFSRPKP
jgi:hypothetical protein